METSRIIPERLERKIEYEPMSGCWLWMGASSANRANVMWKGKKQGAYRAIWEILNGPIEAGLFVCHRCDNPMCVNPSHLFLGSHSDNMRDMQRKGRDNYPKGARQGNSKLTEKQAIEIKNSTEVRKIIADRYGVSGQTVYEIRTGRRWAYLG